MSVMKPMYEQWLIWKQSFVSKADRLVQYISLHNINIPLVEEHKYFISSSESLISHDYQLYKVQGFKSD